MKSLMRFTKFGDFPTLTDGGMHQEIAEITICSLTVIRL